MLTIGEMRALEKPWVVYTSDVKKCKVDEEHCWMPASIISALSFDDQKRVNIFSFMPQSHH